MSLDDLVPEDKKDSQPDKYAVGEVNSRKKPENVTSTVDWGLEIAAWSPNMFQMFARGRKNSEIKLFIELLDTIIQEEYDRVEVTDEMEREARNTREQLVAILKDRRGD